MLAAPKLTNVQFKILQFSVIFSIAKYKSKSHIIQMKILFQKYNEHRQ